MNVLVCTAGAPFVRDEIDELSERLVVALLAHGASAESLRIPYRPSTFADAVDEFILMRNLRVENVDRLIALRFPASLVQHASKVLWLHDAPTSSDPAFADRATPIRHASLRAVVEAKRLYAATAAIARDIRQLHGFDNELLPDPTPHADWGPIVERLLA